MKRFNFKQYTGKLALGLALGVALASCNKDLPEAAPIVPPLSNGSIGEYIASDTNYRLFRLAQNKVGLTSTLSDRSRVFTVYAPSNAAFRAIGFDSLQIVNATGAALTSLGGIVNFHIIPGQIFPSSQIPTTFPNIQLPTNIALGSLPGTAIPFPLTTFLSRRASGFWYNNVPGVGTEVAFTNGSLNMISRVSIPPSTVVAGIVYADPTLTIWSALIAKGDSGQAPASKIDSVMRNPGANMTMFAPNNSGMKIILSQLSGGLLPVGAPDANFIGFINANVPAATARGIVAYHILAVANSLGSFVPHRVFSVNFNATPAFYQTLVNGSVAIHPGVSVTSFFTGQVVDSMKIIGIGAGSVTATSKPASNFDKNAVNGVVHIIDQVLRPQ